MKIALIGYGKMGKAIEEMALRQGHSIVWKTNSSDRGTWKGQDPRQADVAIEFTRPESAFVNVVKCFEAGLPVVSGTTGWQHRLAEVQTLCFEKGGAFFYASNFSIGVHLFFAVNRYLARLMQDQPSYEVEIEEIHHVQKRDAPSGTAITLARDILDRIGRKSQWAKAPAQTPEELAILSRRLDDITGTHKVVYHSAIDTISIRHEALSREGFAAGALQAARWLIGKKGYFGMEDMLGF